MRVIGTAGHVDHGKSTLVQALTGTHPDRLKEELLAAAAKTPNLKIAINADETAPFGRIVKVMDAAKAAGIKIVNAFTKAPK